MAATNNGTEFKSFRRLGLAIPLIGVVWFVVMVYYGTNAPTVMDESSGRVYAYNYHGTVVYLNLMEQILLYALPILALLIFVVLLVLNRSHTRKNKHSHR